MNYFVVMQDYGDRGLEAVVEPHLDRIAIIARIKTREYDNIVRIDHVNDGLVFDVTTELIDAAEAELAETFESDTPLPASVVPPVR